MTLTPEQIEAMEPDWTKGLDENFERLKAAALEALEAAERRAGEAEARIAEVQFRPLGDNHHNAMACPYCNPDKLNPQALRARVERLEASREVAWPEAKITNPDLARPTGVPYLDCLIHRLLDAQQDINVEANERMSQSLCNVSALFDELEDAIRQFATFTEKEPTDG